MAQCKNCQQPIRWQREGNRFIALNPTDGSLHRSTCTVPNVCRNCDRPVVWREQEGKRQCFEPDGTTL